MNDTKQSCNCSGGCDSANRRDFLKLVGLGTAAIATGMPVMAGPFEPSDFEKLIPADKKLSAEWIKSLFARGSRTVYHGDELEKIGMPIGGICAGQVYLGGDGKLWHWDIFNNRIATSEAHYAKPPKPDFPIEQGFAIRVRSRDKLDLRALDHTGFADISFSGEYPIGHVAYRDPACPVSVSLEAFSPFIPLNPHDSHLPATIQRFTIKNTSTAKAECDLVGWLENAVCLGSDQWNFGTRTNTIVRQSGVTLLECTASPSASPKPPERPAIVFADFEAGDYGRWKTEGDAFGKGPTKGAANPVQKLSGFLGKGLANSWPGFDDPKGKLISPEFTIERSCISFLIAGGNFPDETCINLVVDGKVVRSATGKNSDAMAWTDWGVRSLIGKKAHIEIVDSRSEGWGHIEIDQIEFSDRPRVAVTTAPVKDQPDFGSLSLALLDAQPDDMASPAVPKGVFPQVVFSKTGLASDSHSASEFPERVVGALGRKTSLEPGEQTTVTFVVSWYFPNVQHLGLKNIEGRQYGKRFASARAVAEHIVTKYPELLRQTHLWHDVWYDSTLPYWFLDRTFINTSTLATSTAYWFGNNRFYGWEGVGCCEGTCQHVWHYAQAMARIFPTLERTTREMVDYGIAFHADTGAMDYRAEFGSITAADGQSGTIIRAYREHQMSPDDAFLRRNWAKIKKSLQFLMAQDVNKDGILDGAQYNTLDAAWFGKIAWISSLYVAALRAGEQMALERGDAAFAKQTQSLADAGMRNIDQQLFNGEYYIQTHDKDHPNEVGSYDSCEIDQVFGQSWAFQVGLGRVLPREHTLSALRSLWKYNFSPDVGAFRKANPAGRWYAMAGEGGLIMATWPKNAKSRVQKDCDFYLNECMTGFEYQVAGHMIWEGMVQEGLAIVRAIHDRYHASRRNPWNEVECGDHYARAMASYGVFLAACGYEYHGPKGHLAFSPKLSPEDFRAAFTAAEGWGTFSQKRESALQRNVVAIKWGNLSLQTLAFDLPEGVALRMATVAIGNRVLGAHAKQDRCRVNVALDVPVVISSGEELVVEMAT